MGLSSRSLLESTNVKTIKSNRNTELPQNKYKWDIIWLNLTLFVYFYLFAIYGIYLAITVAKWKTLLFSIVWVICACLGLTAGVHRLWAHRSYKAKLPLRILLLFFLCLSHQNSIYFWTRDHRVHHKYTDTDADPHNSKRGFFFSHCGWLMMKKHKEVIAKGNTIDLSDLKSDPVVMFQKKYYTMLTISCCFILPTIIPWYFWNEPLLVAYHVGIARFMFDTNCTFSVNSFAHIYGTKPYDKNIRPTENKMVSYLRLGEGWHNYHHIFPWDYKASEFGGNFPNLSKAFIDFFAWVGWAYDLKTVSPDLIKQRMIRTGDGSRLPQKSEDGDEEISLPSGDIWGWGDINMKPEDFQYVKRFYVK